MARFRLNGPHYIRIAGVDWEQSETDLISGKQVRKRYPVPSLFDPEKDPSCHNYLGEVIVSTKASPQFPRDYIMEQGPTLDMTALDDEAEALMAIERKRGEHPIDSLPANGETYSEVLLRRLEEKLSATGPVRSDDRVAALEQQLAELREILLAQASPSVKSAGISLGGK